MSWARASDVQIFRRMMRLEGALAVAAAIADQLAIEVERHGGPRVPLVTEHLVKWQALLDAQPSPEAHP
jgi:hypothetical protein